MDAVVIKLINMSITASWLVLAVIALRFILRKAPKWIMGILWSFVAFRLIFPISLESVFSLIPSAEAISQNVFITGIDGAGGTLPSVNQAVNTGAALAGGAENGMEIGLIAFAVWISGAAAMLLYTLISYFRILKKVRESVVFKENIMMCDRISTPFILGVFRPRVYIPASISKTDLEYVISHEQAHLRRRDHIWKPLGFFLLTVYWFNPVLWAAYALLCRDIELACDEKVIRKLGAQSKKPYSEALINCSVPRRAISACPLAFGETGVKERVKGVLSYKKPALWIILAAVAVCVITAACLLTNPKPYNFSDMNSSLRKLIETQIIEYNKSDTVNDNFIAVDCEVLKIDETPLKTTVYIWALYIEYSYSDGELKEETASHTPVVITALKNKSETAEGEISYEPAEYWTPRDGSLYKDDIKNRFPIYLWSKALNGSRYTDRQNASCLKSAMEHYGISVSDTGGADKADSVVITPAQNPLNYSYSSGTDSAALTLDPQNGKFTFAYSLLNGAVAEGSYEENDELITAVSSDGFEYAFKKDGDSLVFAAKLSSALPEYDYLCSAKPELCVPDGAVFQSGGSKAHCYFNAEVLEAGKDLLVEPEKGSDEIKSSDKIYVSLNFLSDAPVPEIKAGDRVRVVYSGEIAESYPAQINRVFAVYLLDSDGKVKYDPSAG